MDVLKRLDDLMKERGWSDYRLAQNSKLSSSTIANIRSRNTVPSVVTLESICNAFGITLAQFFADNQTMVHLTPEQRESVPPANHSMNGGIYHERTTI